MRINNYLKFSSLALIDAFFPYMPAIGDILQEIGTRRKVYGKYMKVHNTERSLIKMMKL